MTESERLAELVSYLQDVPKMVLEAYGAVNQSDLERNDLLHYIEMREDADVEEAYSRLRGVNIRRRQAKDTLAVLEPLASWIEKNQKEVNKLSEVLGKMRRAESGIEGRVYSTRTDILNGLIDGNWFGKDRKDDSD